MRQWLIACALAVLSVAAVSVNAANLMEGTDYAVLDPAKPTSNPGKIVVTEFFSYQCPHCYHFSFVIDPWKAKLPSDVVFERIPVSFGRPNWASIAQAFYALQDMGKLDDKMDTAIFSAIHEQQIQLGDLSSITDWLVKQGINGKDFVDMYNSFGVKMSMNRGEQAAPAYNIDGVPTLIVDGKYRLLAPKNLTNELDMAKRELEVVDQLIGMVRSARGMPAPVTKQTAISNPAHNVDAKNNSKKKLANTAKQAKRSSVHSSTQNASVKNDSKQLVAANNQ